MIIVTPRETIDLSEQDRNRRVSALQQLFRDLYDRYEIVQEVLIDGVSFREGYNDYLIENMETVHRVEIRTVPADELMREIVEELKGYLPRLLNACDSISELFYGEMKQEHWTFFNRLTEGIGWVTESVSALRHHLDRTGKDAALMAALNEFEAEVRGQLTELARELESGDHTAAGDRIKYEFPPLFETLLARLAVG